MERKGYTIIQDWMLDLPLSLAETVIYAIIYGFSQDGESVFSGSLAYIAEKAKSSKDTARRALARLVEKGLIQRIEVTKNGVKFNDYRVLPLQGGVANCKGGDSKLQPQKKEHNKDIYTYSNKGKSVFQKPSLQEVEQYCFEGGHRISPEAFVNYYEANGWMVGKNKMKDWKAAVRNWAAREKKSPNRNGSTSMKSVAAHNEEIIREIMGYE